MVKLIINTKKRIMALEDFVKVLNDMLKDKEKDTQYVYFIVEAIDEKIGRDKVLIKEKIKDVSNKAKIGYLQLKKGMGKWIF